MSTSDLLGTKIPLATDGSEKAELAARTAADLAAKTGSELHVVHVLVAPYPNVASCRYHSPRDGRW
jgi:nucleotide-binding universal stress UspA family protein